MMLGFFFINERKHFRMIISLHSSCIWVFLNIILRIFRSQDVVTIVYNNTDDREKIQVTHIYQEPGLSVWRNFPKITHQWYRNKLKLTLVLCETYAVNYLFHERKKYVKLLTVACFESPILPNVPRLLQIRQK